LTFNVQNVHAVVLTETKAFEAMSYTKSRYAYNAVYADCWNSSTSSAWGLTGWYIGGQVNTTDYNIFRTFPFFNTLTLPNDAVITGGILSLYVVTDNTTGSDFNLTIQNGQPTYPHIPVVSNDFYQGYYSGNGGSRNTSDAMSLGAYWNITLSGTGLTWINKTDITKFVLRSDRDISATAPSADEFIVVLSYSATYAPILYLTYVYSPSFYYVTRGAYYENGTVCIVNVSITLYRQYEPPETRVLNATAGVEDVEEWYASDRPYYFSWNISSPILNQSRSFWLTDEAFENIYICVPDPDTSVYQYSFIVNDIAGISNAFLESDINVNGFNRLVERKRIDGINPVVFWMSQFHRYSITLVCDKGTYVYGSGFEAGTTASTEITISQFSFPITYSYYNVSISGVRTNSSYCSVYYSDNLSQTNSLNISIIYLSGSTWTLQYSVTSTSQTTTMTYNGLSGSRDYIANITANRSTGVYSWKVPLSYSNASGTDIFASMNALFPDSPVPVSNFLGLFILFCLFAIFSYIYLELALFLVALFNIIFVAIGMMQTPYTVLSLSMTIVVFASIKRYRMRSGE
jgi:hypothetical protein